MNNKIELRDLVWKKFNKDEEINLLHKNWFDKYLQNSNSYRIETFYFDNAEQIAKEKAEIINKDFKSRESQEDLKNMFIEAGFNKVGMNYVAYTANDISLTVTFHDTAVFNLKEGYNPTLKFIYSILNSDTLDKCKPSNISNSSPNTGESIAIKFTDKRSINMHYNFYRQILNREHSNEL